MPFEYSLELYCEHGGLESVSSVEGGNAQGIRRAPRRRREPRAGRGGRGGSRSPYVGDQGPDENTSAGGGGGGGTNSGDNFGSGSTSVTKRIPTVRC
ncbi:unnamed protein product [Soboliphyme baturini]|uniref:Uncharacterized protein n=1 Tax=Soboliphyme baturini TaxID=241478 RepID=A0A183J5T7_9BILA|nr:unnamed protein product [Soboliphyme baturini]